MFAYNKCRTVALTFLFALAYRFSVHSFFFRFRLGKPLDALENKENNRVSYENLHMDHIAALIAEGYAQNEVIRALGIARNDLQMARDILHEFVTKRK